MADEAPQSQEWQEIFELLSDENYRKIMDRKIAIQKEKVEKKRSTMTDEEKKEEAEKWKDIHNDPTPRFYGNMGEPETREEYERKYGKKPKKD